MDTVRAPMMQAAAIVAAGHQSSVSTQNAMNVNQIDNIHHPHAPLGSHNEGAHAVGLGGVAGGNGSLSNSSLIGGSNSSCSSSSSASSSASSGYSSSSATPTNSYETHTAASTPVAIAEPIIPIATVAAVSPYYSEAISTHSLQGQNYSSQQHLQQQQQHQQQQQPQQQQQLQQLPHSQHLSSLHQSHPQSQLHLLQSLPQQQQSPYQQNLQSTQRQQYYSTSTYDYQQQAPLQQQQYQATHNLSPSYNSMGSSPPAFDSSSPASGIATTYQAAAQYKSTGMATSGGYERSRTASLAAAGSASLSVAVNNQNPYQQQHVTNEAALKSASLSQRQQQHSSLASTSGSKSRSSSSLLSSSSTSTSKPQAAATPFYAQPITQQSSNSGSSYYDSLKHKMPLDYHDNFANFSNAASYHQQQKYYAAAKTQLKEASTYGSQTTLTGKASTLYPATNNYYGNATTQHAAATGYDKYMYPAAYPALSYDTPIETGYRKSNAANTLSSSSWPWGIEYAAGNSRSIPPPPPSGHIPTATVAPTHATYLTPANTSHLTRDPYFMTHDKYAMKYDKYPPYQQTYVGAPAARHNLWPGAHSSLAERLPPPPHALHSAPYYPSSTAPAALSSRQTCCTQPYQAQSCYYPPSRLPPHGQAAAMAQSSSHYMTNPTQPVNHTHQPHLSPLGSNYKYDNALDYGSAAKLKAPNDLYLSSHYEASPTTHHLPHNHNYSYAAASGAGSQRMYRPNQGHHLGAQPAGPLITNEHPAASATSYSTDLSLNSNSYDGYHQDSSTLMNPTPTLGLHSAAVTGSYSSSTAAKRALLDYRKPLQTQPSQEDMYHNASMSINSKYQAAEFLNTPETTTTFNEYETQSQASGGTVASDGSPGPGVTTVRSQDENTKNLSLRDFIANWNDDEEDYAANEDVSTTYVAQPSAVEPELAQVNDSVTIPQQQQIETEAAEQAIKEAIVPPIAEMNIPAEDKTKPAKSINEAAAIDEDATAYGNLPDIVIDIEKSNVSGVNTATDIPLSLDDFDVEKELDQLQMRKGDKDSMKAKPNYDINQTKDINPNLETAKEGGEHGKGLQAQTSFENLQVDKTKANAASAISTDLHNCAAEQLLKDIEGYDSSSSRQSNESSLFEKEYETFINRITKPSCESVYIENTSEVIQVNKGKRKPKNEDEKIPLGALEEQAKNKKLKSGETDSVRDSNFPQAYTRKSRNRTQSCSSVQKRKPLSIFYKAMRSIRRYRRCRFRNVRNSINDIKEKHLPLIKRQSMKNFSLSKEDIQPLYNSKSLKNLVLTLINTEAFRKRLLAADVLDGAQEVEEEEEDKHMCVDPTCETCEVIRSLMEPATFGESLEVQILNENNETSSLIELNDDQLEDLQSIKNANDALTESFSLADLKTLNTPTSTLGHQEDAADQLVRTMAMENVNKEMLPLNSGSVSWPSEEDKSSFFNQEIKKHDDLEENQKFLSHTPPNELVSNDISANPSLDGLKLEASLVQHFDNELESNIRIPKDQCMDGIEAEECNKIIQKTHDAFPPTVVPGVQSREPEKDVIGMQNNQAITPARATDDFGYIKPQTPTKYIPESTEKPIPTVVALTESSKESSSELPESPTGGNETDSSDSDTECNSSSCSSSSDSSEDDDDNESDASSNSSSEDSMSSDNYNRKRKISNSTDERSRKVQILSTYENLEETEGSSMDEKQTSELARDIKKNMENYNRSPEVLLLSSNEDLRQIESARSDCIENSIPAKLVGELGDNKTDDRNISQDQLMSDNEDLSEIESSEFVKERNHSMIDKERSPKNLLFSDNKGLEEIKSPRGEHSIRCKSVEYVGEMMKNETQDISDEVKEPRTGAEYSGSTDARNSNAIDVRSDDGNESQLDSEESEDEESLEDNSQPLMKAEHEKIKYTDSLLNLMESSTNDVKTISSGNESDLPIKSENLFLQDEKELVMPIFDKEIGYIESPLDLLDSSKDTVQDIASDYGSEMSKICKEIKKSIDGASLRPEANFSDMEQVKDAESSMGKKMESTDEKLEYVRPMKDDVKDTAHNNASTTQKHSELDRESADRDIVMQPPEATRECIFLDSPSKDLLQSCTKPQETSSIEVTNLTGVNAVQEIHKDVTSSINLLKEDEVPESVTETVVTIREEFVYGCSKEMADHLEEIRQILNRQALEENSQKTCQVVDEIPHGTFDIHYTSDRERATPMDICRNNIPKASIKATPTSKSSSSEAVDIDTTFSRDYNFLNTPVMSAKNQLESPTTNGRPISHEVIAPSKHESPKFPRIRPIIVRTLSEDNHAIVEASSDSSTSTSDTSDDEAAPSSPHVRPRIILAIRRTSEVIQHIGEASTSSESDDDDESENKTSNTNVATKPKTSAYKSHFRAELRSSFSSNEAIELRTTLSPTLSKISDEPKIFKTISNAEGFVTSVKNPKDMKSAQKVGELNAVKCINDFTEQSRRLDFESPACSSDNEESTESRIRETLSDTSLISKNSNHPNHLKCDSCEDMNRLKQSRNFIQPIADESISIDDLKHETMDKTEASNKDLTKSEDKNEKERKVLGELGGNEKLNAAAISPEINRNTEDDETFCLNNIESLQSFRVINEDELHHTYENKTFEAYVAEREMSSSLPCNVNSHTVIYNKLHSLDNLNSKMTTASSQYQNDDNEPSHLSTEKPEDAARNSTNQKNQLITLATRKFYLNTEDVSTEMSEMKNNANQLGNIIVKQNELQKALDKNSSAAEDLNYSKNLTKDDDGEYDIICHNLNKKSSIHKFTERKKPDDVKIFEITDGTVLKKSPNIRNGGPVQNAVVHSEVSIITPKGVNKETMENCSASNDLTPTIFLLSDVNKDMEKYSVPKDLQPVIVLAKDVKEVEKEVLSTKSLDPTIISPLNADETREKHLSNKVSVIAFSKRSTSSHRNRPERPKEIQTESCNDFETLKTESNQSPGTPKVNNLTTDEFLGVNEGVEMETSNSSTQSTIVQNISTRNDDPEILNIITDHSNNEYFSKYVPSHSPQGNLMLKERISPKDEIQTPVPFENIIERSSVEKESSPELYCNRMWSAKFKTPSPVIFTSEGSDDICSEKNTEFITEGHQRAESQLQTPEQSPLHCHITSPTKLSDDPFSPTSHRTQSDFNFAVHEELPSNTYIERQSSPLSIDSWKLYSLENDSPVLDNSSDDSTSRSEEFHSASESVEMEKLPVKLLKTSSVSTSEEELSASSSSDQNSDKESRIYPRFGRYKNYQYKQLENRVQQSSEKEKEMEVASKITETPRSQHCEEDVINTIVHQFPAKIQTVSTATNYKESIKGRRKNKAELKEVLMANEVLPSVAENFIPAIKSSITPAPLPISSSPQDDVSAEFIGFKQQSSFDDETGDFHGFEDQLEEERIRREMECLNDDSTANDAFPDITDTAKTSNCSRMSSDLDELEALEKELSQQYMLQEGQHHPLYVNEDLTSTDSHLLNVTNVSISTNDIEHIKKMLESDEEHGDNDELKLQLQQDQEVDTNESAALACVHSVPKLSDLCRAALKSSSHTSSLTIVQNTSDDPAIISPSIVQPSNPLACPKTTKATTVNVPLVLQSNESDLSVEDALAEMYRQAGVLLSDPEDTDSEKPNNAEETRDVVLINLQEILNSDNDNIYVLQCDMSEQEEEPGIQSQAITTLDGEETRESSVTAVNSLQIIGILNTNSENSEIHIISSDSESEVIILSDCDTNVEFPAPAQPTAKALRKEFIPFISDFDGTEDSLSDISTIHHEEIVPDNLDKFLQEEFYKYLREKYAQRKMSKFYHMLKILKKYKRRGCGMMKAEM